MSTAPSANASHRRRWSQFSLRTLLLAMLVLGAGLGPLGYKVFDVPVRRVAPYR
jgi:hypothetical protein